MTLATPADTAASIAEQVVIKGDLSKLTEQQRMTYYTEVCRSLGLNPLTRPFDYIVLNGKMVLYATRGCADQLRAIRAITITSLDPRQVGELFVVVATGRDRTGREDSSTGAVSTVGLRGEALANAMMKAETKAKRRLTLSLSGLGLSDETEVDSIPGALRQDVDPETGEIRRPQSLAERAAERRASLDAAPARCQSVPADGEQCAREQGHDGDHRNHAGDRWSQPAQDAPSAPEHAAPAPDAPDPAEEAVAREACDARAADGIMAGSVCGLAAEHTGAHKSADGSWPR